MVSILVRVYCRILNVTVKGVVGMGLGAAMPTMKAHAQCCNESPQNRVTSRVRSLGDHVKSSRVIDFARVESSVASHESSQWLDTG